MEGKSPMLVNVSVGEYFDKFSILQIKSEKIVDPSKLTHVIKERSYLESIMEDLSHILESDSYRDLHEVNLALWDIEDRIRQKEDLKEYDDEFIDLSRKIYIMNDERFNHKNEISKMASSEYMEQKSHRNCR